LKLFTKKFSSLIPLLSHFLLVIARWMNGSLFFRGLTAVFDFIKKICANSFTGRAFVADTEPLNSSIKRSFFGSFVSKTLNGFPKPLTSPSHWNPILSKLCSGSWLVNSFCNNVDISIPMPGERSKVGFGVSALFQWALFAFPVIGIVAVLFATPFLPTMVLAGLMLPILVLLFFSRKFVVDSTAVFLLIFIVVSMIAAVFSLAPASSIQIALLTSVFMLSTLVVVACCTTARSVDFFIKAFIISAAFTGLVGLWQRVAGYASGIWLDQELFAGQARVFSTFGNPNVYGTYLLLAIPVAAACVVYLKGAFVKLCAAGITGLLLINLLLTLSRGCYLSLALAVGVFVLIMEKRLVVLFAPAVAAMPFILPPAVFNRILSILDTTDTSTAFRLNIWRGSVRMLQDFWLGGVGQGIDAYNTVYPFYALAAIYSPHSHSLYIQYLVEIGVIGFLVFVAVLACYFRTMANFLRRATEFRHRVMAAAMVAAVVGFLFQGVTDFVFYNYRVLLTFYLFIGISIAFARANMSPTPATDKSTLVSNYHEE